MSKYVTEKEKLISAQAHVDFTLVTRRFKRKAKVLLNRPSAFPLQARRVIILLLLISINGATKRRFYRR